MFRSIIDYLEWRGDLSFQQLELGEVDALIFAWLIYYTMEDLQEKGIKVAGLTVKEVAEEHVKQFGPFKDVDPMKKPFPVENAELMFRMASETERFGNAVVEDFAALNGKMSGAQFAAGCFLPGDGSRVVAFRGTDTSVAGWKENFRMAYEQRVPAQLLASAYLEKSVDERPIIICGHSKGGNLATYTAMQSRDATDQKIRKVYNFDGPGFGYNWKATEKFARLRDRLVTIVPESTIIGALLDHDDQCGIIQSEMTGFLQHNAFCWHVKRSEFVRVESRSKSSLAIEKAMIGWLGDLNDTERKEAVQMLFGIIEEMGMTDFRELGDDTARKVMQLLKGLNGWSPRQKERIGRLIVELLRQSGFNMPANMAEKILIKGEDAGQVIDKA